jgi:hypothetical protein
MLLLLLLLLLLWRWSQLRYGLTPGDGTFHNLAANSGCHAAGRTAVKLCRRVVVSLLLLLLLLL